jgi:hypothetical protein
MQRSALLPRRGRQTVDLLTDVLVVVGIAVAVAIGVLYVYLADRMVSSR